MRTRRSPGAPFLVKDLGIGVAGWPRISGNRFRRNVMDGRHRADATLPGGGRRAARAGGIKMSPFNAGPAASLSFHQCAKMPWRGTFAEIEAIFHGGAGRPHWAKRHTLTAADVHRL